MEPALQDAINCSSVQSGKTYSESQIYKGVESAKLRTRLTLSDEGTAEPGTTRTRTAGTPPKAPQVSHVQPGDETARQREERLRLTLDAANIGTWNWDIATGKVEWSENMERIHGQAPGSFGGSFDAFLKTVHGDDRGHVMAAIQGALEGDGRYQVEYRQLTGSGETKWMEGKGRAIYDEVHRPVRMTGVCADVTARKQIEEDLKRTRDELESRVVKRTLELTQLNQILSEKARLLEIAHDGIIVRSVNSAILFWNQGAELIYGWKAEEALGKVTHALLQTRFPEPLKEVEARIFGEGWWEGELVHTRRDGTEITVASRWVLQRTDEGRPVAILEINRDITEHKRAQLGLQESEARLRSLVESTDDVIFELDEDGTYLNVWTTNEQLLARPKQELLGHHIDEVLGAEAARPFLEACGRVLCTGRSEGIEYSLDFPGARRWFLGRISPIGPTNASGRRLCLFVREITDRKRAEEDVRHGAERFRLLVEEVKDYAIFMLDPEGRIVTWNVGAERIKGYRPEEIIGESFSLFYPPEDVRAGKPGRLLTIAAIEGRVEDEGWRVRKDGSRFWADVVITALRDETGNLRGFAKVTRDVTETKRSQEAVRQLSGRLLRLQDEERRRMARELHDSTAQTLAALSLNLALVSQRARASLDPKASKCLEESIQLAEQASREIRTFSYLLHPPMLDEAGLPYALQWYTNGFAQRTRIHVDCEVSPELGRLPADVETALFRIVQECLTNIHRHSGSPTARIRLRHDSGQVTLEVADAGKGFPGGALPEGDGGAATLGVGIRGMRERVRQLGGRLEVKHGQPGTIVEVVLPLPGEAR